jgi:Fur family zinc uptake transcriptional regulator
MVNGNILAPFQPKNHDHGKCVVDAIEAAEARCARDGRSFTPLRRRVLELVWSSHGPVGAYDLLDALRAERRGAVPPTIYRALDFLMGNGLIHRIESQNAYVGCGSPDHHPDHHHGGQFLICRDCGSVAELDDPAIARTVAKRARALGFDAESQTIEVSGLCPRCTRTPEGGTADSLERHAS